MQSLPENRWLRPTLRTVSYTHLALRTGVQQELKMETKTMDIRFATINDIDAVTEMERQCFPPEEAAEKDSFEKRLTVFPNHFWLLEDSGKLASMINGMTTDIPILRDEMFEDATMHREEGQWQMIFGAVSYTHLDVYKRQMLVNPDRSAQQ